MHSYPSRASPEPWLLTQTWSSYLVSIMAADWLGGHVREVKKLPVGQVPPCQAPPEGLAQILASGLQRNLLSNLAYL